MKTPVPTPVDQIAENLNNTLDIWSPENTHDSSTTLSQIWKQKNTSKYYPKGPKKLIKLLGENELFGKCPLLDKLEIERFSSKGDIQNYLDLYDNLFGCRNV